MSIRRLHSARRLFPVPLSDVERRMLNYLSTDSGLTRSAVIRRLLMQEVAARQLASAKPAPRQELKVGT